ncbi:leucine dehydrogenase [Vulcanibacillus modesticaldus]|uniref:Leucine dehydrogenase n=1 Tax=Vulcanibacillus modesticaldus TaxID=337097 RepID=A0A1D2YSZ5_9BACI|nr:amino acid dehydrogenase [Vulcanibacillus modesticaldus]OEF98842.1 leucine dehydrogenase [Vulcanibacillus modesticaldus]
MKNERKDVFSIFEQMEKYGHEQVIFNYDKATGLKSIIAIHDTTLGPALGGCRMWNYETEQDAIKDALRLSRGMTYKCAVSNIMHGGGKAVIIGDPRKDKTPELFQSLGTFVETLKGRYYTGTDVGTVGMDFVHAAKQSEYIVGLPEEYGGSGNSAIITAYGVWRGMKATAKEVFGTDSLEGLTVAVQGLGKVGYVLVKYLIEEGARVIATDIMEDNINRVKEEFPEVEIVSPNEIFGVECDIFSPNALGAVINDETISQFKCKAICGAANNVLAEEHHGDFLHEKGILYAPDYVVNAGGLIQVADELQGYNKDRAFRNASLIYDTLTEIFTISKEENMPTYKAADKLVEKRIEIIGQLQSKYTGR